jgi:hypothetical protein
MRRTKQSKAAASHMPDNPQSVFISALWRRLDTPGHDAAHVSRTDDGWRLDGAAVFAPVAWLDVPGASLTQLPQRYERRTDRIVGGED